MSEKKIGDLRLPHDIDIHTHSGPARRDAVLCVDPVDETDLPEGDGLLSVGVHPWNAERVTEETWARLERWLADGRVVAIGEVGLDKLRGGETAVQLAVFERQIELGKRHGLPLVIHCVRSWDSLLAARGRHADSGQWIVHGFRGKAALAKQLLGAGMDLSFGKLRNEEAYECVPAERRYHETD